MDDEDRVRYLKEGPSHAVEDALTLEVLGPGQGQGSFSRTPVEIEVSAGDMEFREDDIAISLKFRRVFVALILALRQPSGMIVLMRFIKRRQHVSNDSSSSP